MDSAKIHRLEKERARTVIHYEGHLVSFSSDLHLTVVNDNEYEFMLCYNQNILEIFLLKVIYMSNNWLGLSGQLPRNMHCVIWTMIQLCQECDQNVKTVICEVARRHSIFLSASVLKFVNILLGKRKIYLYFE